MKFSELATKRRSTRNFTDQRLSPEQVENLMKVVLMAPSSKNKTPWEFVLIEDRDMLKKLSCCKGRAAKPLENCSLAIAVIVDPLVSDVWVEDASIASIMIQFQAEDMGLGSCWIQIRERFTADGQSAEEYVRLLLNTPMQMQVLSIIAVGYKMEEKERINESNLKWEKIHLNKYSD